MFRTELPDSKGMLFPYDEPRELSMWMHNTYIPLDMVFIRPDGVIHRIETRAEPMSERIISSGGAGVGGAGARRRRYRAARHQGRRPGALSAVQIAPQSASGLMRPSACPCRCPRSVVIRRVYSAGAIA